MTAPDSASQRQIEAANPAASTWLSANAGSGKTRVLIDRVARLLLDGVDPLHILCLTYTKAAASEMQNRLFKRLGSWAMMPDLTLTAELVALGIEGGIEPSLLGRARRLFARAIETPGGLKIQTIHSFCAGLLRRFPLEAGVSPQFTEMDDRAARLLREEILEDMAQGPEADTLRQLVGHYTGGDLSRLLKDIAGKRSAFARKVTRDQLLQLAGLPAGFDAACLLQEVFLGEEAALFRQILPIVATGKPTDVKLFHQISAVDPREPTLGHLGVLEDALLTGEKATVPYAAKIDAIPTKDIRSALGPLIEPLNDLMLRVEASRPRRIALMAAERSLALHDFARPFLSAYATRKEARGWLDFDDLILKARDLLSDRGVAQWVLFRLDGGIDHILVDEAQDTSPAQWDVIERLTQEFGAGVGAREGINRTIFVVGDKKQSIYSFQGADLRAFDQMRQQFDDRLAAGNIGLQRLTLEYSFRSAHPILRAVDLTFPTALLNSLGGDVKHLAFDLRRPGRVDLWPPVPPSAKGEPAEWHAPVDSVAEDHADVQLARQIAKWIKQQLDAGTMLPGQGDRPARPMRAGDVLILVQRRSRLFAETIRALKAAGLPVAGADRLKLGAELAVRDLAALLSFLATPEDDLSLATVLRSPLCGWSEDRLYRLAQPRGDAYLWRELSDRAAEHPETFAFLKDLRDQADFLRPYDLLERVLIRHDGRRKLLARLGAEAEDGIDALLQQALAHERMEIPSLTGFLAWMETDDVEIKRRLDGDGSLIRVMTVHGAKGLEAPVVILPDTAKRKPPQPGDVIQMPDGHVVWPPNKEERPPDQAARRAELEQRLREENLRLLYVAMTRAESWLVVCCAGEPGAPGAGESWYDLVSGGLQSAVAVPYADFPTGPGLRLAEGDWPDAAVCVMPDKADAEPGPLADWMLRPPPPRDRPASPVSASALPGAKALPGEGLETDAAQRYGTALHLLLQHLPQIPTEVWADFARRLLGETLNRPDIDTVLAEASTVLTAPALAHLFGPATLAEVPLAATLPDGRRLRGIIDRLLIEPDRILAVDFKSNRVLPARPGDVPAGILAQMAAYARALGQIYPGRRIETAILWTRSAVLMPLDPDIVKQAMARPPYLDVDGGEP